MNNISDKPKYNWDRLVDILLREELGGRPMPDLAPKILFRSFPRSKISYLTSNLSAAAVAAILLIFAGIWGLTVFNYPAPEIKGAYTFTHGSGGRGSVIATGEKAAEVVLGGYCEVKVEPQSVIKLEGSRKAEQVFLEKGEITCAVKENIGAFTVRTEVGLIKVTGTEFIVRLLDESLNQQANTNRVRGKDMLNKKIFVKVLAGAVLLTGSWGEVTLNAGEKAIVPEVKAAAVAEETGLKEKLNKEITAFFEGTDIYEVCETIRSQAGINIIIDNSIDPNTIITLQTRQKVKVRDLLKAIAKLIPAPPTPPPPMSKRKMGHGMPAPLGIPVPVTTPRIEMIKVDGVIFFVPNSRLKRFTAFKEENKKLEALKKLNSTVCSLDFWATPVEYIITFISEKARLNLAYASNLNLKGEVTITLNNIKTGDALEWVLWLGQLKLTEDQGFVYLLPNVDDTMRIYDEPSRGGRQRSTGKGVPGIPGMLPSQPMIAPSFAPAPKPADKPNASLQDNMRVSFNNLKQIGLGFVLFINKYNRMPESFEELWDHGNGTVPDARVFQCPTRPAATEGEWRCDYLLLPIAKQNKYLLPPNVVIAMDKPGNFMNGGACLFKDGHVSWAETGDEETYRQLVDKLINNEDQDFIHRYVRGSINGQEGLLPPAQEAEEAPEIF